MGEGNDTLVGLSEGNNSIVGDVQATFADTANDVLRSNETYTEDIQRRREAWSTLAQELGIDEGLVEVTNRIQVKGVADFYLDDSEDASYEELLN